MQKIWTIIMMYQRDRQAGDLVFAIAFLTFTVLVAVSLPWQARFLKAEVLIAQPGFWPVVGVTMMLVFGLLHFFSTHNSPRVPGRLKETLLWARSLEFVAWFVIYVIAAPIIGYLTSTVTFTTLLSLRLGYRSAFALASAAAFAVTVVLVFKSGLGVRLPAGKIYALLPESIRSFVMVNF